MVVLGLAETIARRLGLPAPAPMVCARGLEIDPVLVAGLLLAAGVRWLRLLDDGDDPRLRDALRTCGLQVGD